MANQLKISLPIEGVNGGKNYVIATGKSDLFEFRDGKSQTSEPPIGVKFDCVLPGNRLSALTVKVEGKDPLPKLTDADIVAATEREEFIRLVFSESNVRVYTMNGQIGMSATAKSVAIREHDELNL